MGDIQVVSWLLRWLRIVSFDYFCTPQKASVGMSGFHWGGGGGGGGGRGHSPPPWKLAAPP